MKILIVTAVYFFGLFNLNQSLTAQSSVQIERWQRALATERAVENGQLEKIEQYKAALITAGDRRVIGRLKQMIICSYPALQNSQEKIRALERKIINERTIRHRLEPVAKPGTIKKAEQ